MKLQKQFIPKYSEINKILLCHMMKQDFFARFRSQKGTYQMKGGNAVEDGKIIKLFQERSEDAVKQVRGKYGMMVKSMIKHILSDKSDAEECESDTYMAVWQTIPPAQPTNFRAFLLRIARNQALKKYHFLSAEKRCKSAVVSLEEIGELASEESHICLCSC